VDHTSVFNWEANTSNPAIEYMPAIIRFLGHNPLPLATNMGERLGRHRTTLGLTQKESAKRIGVDAGTLARWEPGEREPTGGFLAVVERFLNARSTKDERLVG
jgi:ribosome-binding protein aMBF1 (putative translation factor)